MRADACELALVHHEIYGPDRLSGEIALENLARACRVACLRRERGARDMWRHTVMRHGTPGMVARRRLREPHVSRIARELTIFERAHDSITIANLAARRVHDVAAALHHADQLVVEHMLSLGMERGVDGHHVAYLDHRLDVRVEGEPELLLDLPGQPVLIVIVQLHVERLESAKCSNSDPARGDRSDIHAFEIV